MHLNDTEDQCNYFSYSKHLYYKYIITVIDISHTYLPSFRPISLKNIVLYLNIEMWTFVLAGTMHLNGT